MAQPIGPVSAVASDGRRRGLLIRRRPRQAKRRVPLHRSALAIPRAQDEASGRDALGRNQDWSQPVEVEAIR
jgi:hypothetical protein